MFWIKGSNNIIYQFSVSFIIAFTWIQGVVMYRSHGATVVMSNFTIVTSHTNITIISSVTFMSNNCKHCLHIVTVIVIILAWGYGKALLMMCISNTTHYAYTTRLRTNGNMTLMNWIYTWLLTTVISWKFYLRYWELH